MEKYNIIYADPAWTFGSSQVCKIKGERFHSLNEVYPTMSNKDIKNLPIKNITAEDCACFLWVTDAHLKEGIEVLESWGFKYKTIAFTWIKTTPKGNICYNLGAWTLKSTEICLLGTKGRMLKYKKNNSIKGLVFEERVRHSQKPYTVRDNIVSLFGDLPRLELFARQKNEGWDVWGNEVECDINMEDLCQENKK